MNPDKKPHPLFPPTPSTYVDSHIQNLLTLPSNLQPILANTFLTTFSDTPQVTHENAQKVSSQISENIQQALKENLEKWKDYVTGVLMGDSEDSVVQKAAVLERLSAEGGDVGGDGEEDVFEELGRLRGKCEYLLKEERRVMGEIERVRRALKEGVVEDMGGIDEGDMDVEKVLGDVEGDLKDIERMEGSCRDILKSIDNEDDADARDGNVSLLKAAKLAAEICENERNGVSGGKRSMVLSSWDKPHVRPRLPKDVSPTALKSIRQRILQSH